MDADGCVAMYGGTGKEADGWMAMTGGTEMDQRRCMDAWIKHGEAQAHEGVGAWPPRMRSGGLEPT